MRRNFIKINLRVNYAPTICVRLICDLFHLQFDFLFIIENCLYRNLVNLYATLNVTCYLYATFYTISYSTRCTCSNASRRNLHASWNSLQKGCCKVFAIVQYWLAGTVMISWRTAKEGRKMDTRCSTSVALWLRKKGAEEKK